MRARVVILSLVTISWASFASSASASDFITRNLRFTKAAISEQASLHPTALPMPVPAYLGKIITEAASTHGVDPNLVAAVCFRTPSLLSRDRVDDGDSGEASKVA